MTPTSSQPKIHIERMMHRSSIMVAGDSAASYALVKLIPAGGGSTSRSPSTSPSSWMLAAPCTKKTAPASAAYAAFRRLLFPPSKRLNPHDNLAIIAFAHNAQVVLPSTPLSEKPPSKT